jgi:hypothetical protein
LKFGKSKGKSNSIMKIGRGLLRLWVVLTVIWTLGSAWELRGDLSADCQNLFRSEDADAAAGCFLENRRSQQQSYQDHEWHPIEPQINAAQWILLPPLALLLLGFLGLWVARGFGRS